VSATDGAGRGSIYIQNETLRRGFTSTPNRVLCNAALSMGARFVYTLLLSYAWQEDRCFPGQERLARDVGCSVRTVQRYLAELEDAGEIHVIQQGLQRPNIYVILDRRADATPLSRQETTTMARPDTPPASPPETTAVAPAVTSPVTRPETTDLSPGKEKRPRSRKHRDADPTPVGGRHGPRAAQGMGTTPGETRPAGSGGRNQQTTARNGRHPRPAGARDAGSGDTIQAPLLEEGHPLPDARSVELLLAEGVSRARAMKLAAQYPPAEILEQIRWLDGRRYDDRAACLVAAIEGRYGPPVANAPRPPRAPLNITSQAGGLPAGAKRYTAGSYGVCPACLSSPCDPECPLGTGRDDGQP
jgi:hypothetical protein